METIRRDYKALCFAPFREVEKKGLYFPVLVYTGEKDADERPVFRTLLAEAPLKVKWPNGKTYWGISCYDANTGESEWFDYRDCVSLEDWDVLCRLLYSQFAWMRQIDGLTEEVILLAKAQFRERR